MAATTSGAFKALIEAAGLGLAVYRDQAPTDAAYPHVTVSERIGLSTELDGDTGDNNASQGVNELVQVDVWQRWRNPDTNAIEESYTIPDALVDLLHGTRLPDAPTKVYGVTVDSSVRLFEPDDNTVHHSITARVRRNAT